jgi:hypothetical protein
LENAEENSGKIRKIWKKCMLNCEMILKNMEETQVE